MPDLAAATAFRQGVVEALPLIVAVAPFGLVFGAIAVASGLTEADALLMSAVVYAGASQLVAVELYGASVPVWSILLSVLAVNFRHVLYSAALTPLVRSQRPLAKALVFALLVDPQFALTERRAAEGHRFSLAWYLGLALPTYASWVTLSGVGAAFGRLLTGTEWLALDFLLPIYFLALVVSFRGRARWGVTVAVSGTVAVAVVAAPRLGLDFLGPPWHVMIGGLAGILAAALLPPRGGGTPVARSAEGQVGAGAIGVAAGRGPSS